MSGEKKYSTRAVRIADDDLGQLPALSFLCCGFFGCSFPRAAFLAGAFFAAASISIKPMGTLTLGETSQIVRVGSNYMNCYRSLFVSMLLVPGLLTCSILAGGFGCSRANSKKEKLICASPTLSKADDAMATAYRGARIVLLLLVTQRHRPSNRARFELTETCGIRNSY